MELITATGLTHVLGRGRQNSTSSVSPTTLNLQSVSMCTICSCAGGMCDMVRWIVGGYPESSAYSGACRGKSNSLLEICIRKKYE